MYAVRPHPERPSTESMFTVRRTSDEGGGPGSPFRWGVDGLGLCLAEERCPDALGSLRAQRLARFARLSNDLALALVLFIGLAAGRQHF